MDGKSLRGAIRVDDHCVHLISALYDDGIVLAQREVDAKHDEITAFGPLLNPLDLTGRVATFDALLTQTDHARFLVEKKDAHCIAVLKGNRPNLQALVKELPRKEVLLLERTRAAAHDRDEIRRLKVVHRAGAAFRADRALRVVRRRQPARTAKVPIECVYAVTSLTAHEAVPADLAECKHVRPAAVLPLCRYAGRSGDRLVR
ncbi:ISAs1 family transposase [Amycolatopsis sp. NPDC005232]|uniref:ISAs1 family transposase n=1 Tax=Amycolatopsis sp. NPDC005232 TaxID=3157027 RepID=UPI0033BCFF68